MTDEIEEEKYEVVEIEDPETEEEVEVEVTEISLSEEEINSWISALEELREKKSGEVSLALDDETELIVTFDASSDEDDEEDDDEDEEMEDDNE